MTFKIQNNLTHFDAVVAVSDRAVNEGFKRLMRGFEAQSEKLEFDIDYDMGTAFEAKVGVPSISFLPEQQHLAKMAFHIVEGTYFGGSVVRRDGTIVEKTTKLDDTTLGYNVDLNAMQKEYFHDSDFQIEALYLEVTKIRNIDTANFGLEIGDLEDVPLILKGLIEKLKAETNDPDNRLFLGGVSVPKVGDVTGNMRPTSAKFTTTAVEENGKSSGEINFLLMMNNRDLPTARSAGIFDTIWTNPDNDATLVLSDYLLLESIALPLLQGNYPDGKFSLARGVGDDRSRIVLNEHFEYETETDKYATIEKCDAEFEDDGRIRIDLHMSRWEKCKIGDVDATLVKAKVGKEQSFYITINIDGNHDLKAEIEEGDVKDRDVVLEQNFEVNEAKDIIKYIISAAELAVPIFGPIVAGLGSFGPALIKAVTTNMAYLKEFKNKFTSTMESTNLAIMLPGAPVFKFKKPRMVGRQMIVDLNYIDMPVLKPSDCAPFEIGPHPTLEGINTAPKYETKPEIIGEVCVPFRLVKDEKYKDTQADRMPYYVLRREQFWRQAYYKSFDGRGSETASISIELSKETSHSDTTTETFNTEVNSSAEFEAFEQSLKIEVDIERGFERTIEDIYSTSSTRTYEEEKEFAAGRPFRIAVYALVDRFVLERDEKPSRSEVKRWENISPNYLQKMVFPEIDPDWSASSNYGADDDDDETPGLGSLAGLGG